MSTIINVLVWKNAIDEVIYSEDEAIHNYTFWVVWKWNQSIGFLKSVNRH